MYCILCTFIAPVMCHHLPGDRIGTPFEVRLNRGIDNFEDTSADLPVL